MRIHFLAVLALVVPACAGDITSPGGGGPGGGAVCGNGVVDPGEQCDDGNTTAGDGCSATCTTEQAPVPHVSLTVDKPTVTTDLNVETDVTVTATSEMGFTGSVTLAAAAADSSNTAITDWTNTLDNTTLTLTDGGTATAKLKVAAMGDTASLTGNITVTATSSAQVPGTATVGVTFNGVLDVTFGDNGGTCAYPTTRSFKIKAGRQLAVYNASTTSKLVVHTGGQIMGFPHEGDTGTAPGAAYVNTLTTGQSDADQFYCHNDGTASPANGYLATGDQSVGPVIQLVP
jgi:cysteine-rich repeat protein